MLLQAVAERAQRTARLTPQPEHGRGMADGRALAKGGQEIRAGRRPRRRSSELTLCASRSFDWRNAKAVLPCDGMAGSISAVRVTVHGRGAILVALLGDLGDGALAKARPMLEGT
jgi:hypothetical protein